MDPSIVATLRAEAAKLREKLTAIEAVVRVYEVPADTAPARVSGVSAFNPNLRRTVERTVIIAGGGTYARSIREAAKKVIKDAPTRPVPTRIIVERVKALGMEIRGQNELNAVSALLSRSDDFKNVDRMGWVMADDADYRDHPGNENGALNGHAASAPEAGEGATSPNENPEEFNL